MNSDERSGSVSIDAALAALLKGTGLLRKDSAEPVYDAWNEIAGEDLTPHCHPLRFSRGELMIEVRSSALLHELENFRSAQLLRALRARPDGAKVTRLVFKAQS
jgi:hypothetical protein